MEFPNLVYISPGNHQCSGGTFNYLQVIDDASLTAAIAQGYYPTPELAVQQPADFSWLDYAEKQGWAAPEPPQVDPNDSPDSTEGVLTMAHRGRGKYDVLDGNGNIVMRSVTKKQAEATGAVLAVAS